MYGHPQKAQMVRLVDDYPDFRYRCACGEVFDVDVFDELNTYFINQEQGSTARCPACHCIAAPPKESNDGLQP